MVFLVVVLMIRRPAAFKFHHQSPALMDIKQACNIQPEILEVKCPYSAKEKTIAEAVDTIAEFCLGKELKIAAFSK